MPDERLITEIESIFNQIVELGAEKERTRMVPNLLVTNDSPAGLPDFVIVRDDRDGDNILATKVPGVIYATNDLVNVLFVRGGEAIAFQQGSKSDNAGIWEIVPGTSTDIVYAKGDVGIGKTIAPDAALEVLSTTQAQLRLTFQEDTKYATFTVDTNHDLTIDPSSTGQIILGSPDVVIEEDLIHSGDTDTKMTYTADDIEFTVGGLSMLQLTEAAQDLITLGPGSGDVDIDFNGDMFLQGSDGFFVIGDTTPYAPLDVARDVGALPAISSATGVLIRNNGDTTDSVLISLICGVDGNCQFTFGDTDSQLRGRLLYRLDTPEYMAFYVNGGEVVRIDDNGDFGIATTNPIGKLHVDQSSATGNEPVLLLDQADVSEEFIYFQGAAAAATLTQSIVAEADVTTATRQGWLKVFVNDVGNQITDQAYFVPIYTLA